ncbi:protein of unknown function [Paraburkholderia dioscoreae]|uniref:Uncharacterized protein n=1 Tax=Paraburkholderia dioscoreae TaxID=2604047 RepID=A0A5Q4ZAB9_9BURK|nr:protein of unknown function [Paraburkholderia dioscoreae]
MIAPTVCAEAFGLCPGAVPQSLARPFGRSIRHMGFVTRFAMKVAKVRPQLRFQASTRGGIMR